jgi:hypothetical protein
MRTATPSQSDAATNLVRKSPRDFEHCSAPILLLSMFPRWQFDETNQKLNRLETEIKSRVKTAKSLDDLVNAVCA